jgi:L-rhamnose isomerase/sugar isomerase
MTARALLVDRDALREAEHAGDVLAGNAVLMDAFSTDVRIDLADWRTSRNLPADPMAAYAASGYAEQIAADRVGGAQAGWGA